MSSIFSFCCFYSSVHWLFYVFWVISLLFCSRIKLIHTEHWKTHTHTHPPLCHWLSVCAFECVHMSLIITRVNLIYLCSGVCVWHWGVPSLWPAVSTTRPVFSLMSLLRPRPLWLSFGWRWFDSSSRPLKPRINSAEGELWSHWDRLWR